MSGQYAPVNGLQMYYEIHGEGKPLVLLHGAFSAIGTSFGTLLPLLAAKRQVIAVELQGHGHTADVPDRPLDLNQLADDVAALVKYLNIPQADFFGYSLGAGVALYVAIHHPEIVRKLVLASVSHTNAGLQPGLVEGMKFLAPELMAGTPWQLEYASIAPKPENWNTLVNKVKDFNLSIPDLPAEKVKAIQSPVLLIIGDADIIQPEHAVEMLRLFGGGYSGDTPAGMPKSRLAILPGTSHVTLVQRADWLNSMVTEFLDAP
jgi:pimeloyl-ACP methyl ester carboxylesterase